MQEAAIVVPEWSLDEIPLAAVDRERARTAEDLFYLVTAASFIESGAELYTDNLACYYGEDAEVIAWLRDHWKVEEMRHGRALRAYVRHVWPEFDWDRAYTSFLADYSQQCTVDQFEPTRGLEMVARCVVETGTATFYQALASRAVEPVLAGIAARIRADEIGHYRHFYRYFRKYSRSEPPGRLHIMAALARRMLEARRGDGDCALRHAFIVRRPEAGGNAAEFKILSRRLSRQLRAHYPIRMAVKMLIKPLDLPASLARALQGPVAQALAWVLR